MIVEVRSLEILKSPSQSEHADRAGGSISSMFLLNFIMTLLRASNCWHHVRLSYQANRRTRPGGSHQHNQLLGTDPFRQQINRLLHLLQSLPHNLRLWHIQYPLLRHSLAEPLPNGRGKLAVRHVHAKVRGDLHPLRGLRFRTRHHRRHQFPPAAAVQDLADGIQSGIFGDSIVCPDHLSPLQVRHHLVHQRSLALIKAHARAQAPDHRMIPPARHAHDLVPSLRGHLHAASAHTARSAPHHQRLAPTSYRAINARRLQPQRRTHEQAARSGVDPQRQHHGVRVRHRVRDLRY